MSSQNIFDLKINESNLPFIRAGYSNSSLLVGISFLLLFNQIFLEFAFHPFYRYSTLLVIGTFFVFLYLSAVSRILIKDRKIVFFRTFGVLTIRENVIFKSYIFSIPSSKFALIILNKSGHLLPTIMHFVARKTNMGNYTESVDALRNKLKELGN